MAPRRARLLLVLALACCAGTRALASPSPPPKGAAPTSVPSQARQMTPSTGSDTPMSPQAAPAVGSMASPGRPMVTPLPAGKRRVCVFDFDDTLKNEGNVLANDAQWAVQACVAHGYEVAIASAGCKTEFVQRFLQRRVDADIFTDEFLNSTAFQVCQKDKTISLTKLVQHFGLDDARQCAILFDDLQYNCRYATSIGMGSRWVDNGALQYKVGEPGIRASDFSAAKAQWARTCPEPAPL